MMKTEFEIKSVPPEMVLPIRQEVMYPGQAEELAKVAGDEEAIHWGLFANNKLVSVISLFNSNKSGNLLPWQIIRERVMVHGYCRKY